MEQVLTRATTYAEGGTALGKTEFEELYRSSRDDVYAYVITLVSDRGAAEDVTAAAFERAYRKRSRFDRRRGQPRTWLFAIARNAALDELRKRKPNATLNDAALEQGLADGGSPSADSLDESVTGRIEMRRALMALPGPDREAIALRYFADLSLKELADTLGISESNAGTRVHRAVEKLREAIDDGR